MGGNPIRDVTPLKGLPIKWLYLVAVKVKDLKPLSESHELRTLHFLSSERVDDLSPLWRLWLHDLLLGLPAKGIRKETKDFLKSFYTLNRIEAIPVIQFWQDHGDHEHAALLLWIEDTRKLRGEKQFEAIRAKMRERNSAFDGKMTPTYSLGELTRLEFSADQVTDIVAVRGAGKLKWLTCIGSAGGRGRLANLAPLRGMKLTNLNVNDTQVKDLWPLRGNGLTEIQFLNTPAKDLEPLRRIRVLETINRMPAAEFWKQNEGGKAALLK